MCAGHHSVFTDEDAVAHIPRSVKAANDYLSMTVVFLARGKGDIDQAINIKRPGRSKGSVQMLTERQHQELSSPAESRK